MWPFASQILHERSLSEQASVIAPGQEQTNPVKEPSSYQLWSRIYWMEALLICLHPINIFSNVPSLPGILFLGISVNESGKYHPFRELAFS